MLDSPVRPQASWGQAAAAAAKSQQSCRTLCDPMDCSLPGSSIHGIFQASVMEWGAIAFSWGVYFNILNPIHVFCFLFLFHFALKYSHKIVWERALSGKFSKSLYV